MRDETSPPKGNPKSTVDKALFQNKEDDKNEEYQRRQKNHAVQPVCVFQSGDELLGSEQEIIQGVVCLGCRS